MDIGQKIIELRKKKGWSQYRLFKEAQIGQSTLSQIESGIKKHPNTVTLQKIAKALGVSMAEFDEDKLSFVMSRRAKLDLTPQQQAAADKLEAMPDEEKRRRMADAEKLLDKIEGLPETPRKALEVIIEYLAATRK